MADGAVGNRWCKVVGAIAVQLCLGAIYAWSVFTPSLTRVAEEGGIYCFTAKQAAWIFSVGLAVFAVVMVVAGRLQARIGPRKVCLLGGIVLGVGYILGGVFGGTFAAQLIFIGVIGGAGIGLAYVVPIAVGVKWFPDKKGMISGLAVAGFGFGATLWVKAAGSWFHLIEKNLFGLPEVQGVFVLYGIAFLVIVALGSIAMVNPPPGWKPQGWEPPSQTDAKAAASGGTDFDSATMKRTPQFYMLWVMFIFSALAGLMVIYCIKLFGIDALHYRGMDVAAASTVAGTAMAAYAILNGLGRIVWGSMSDKIGRKSALTAMCIFQGAIMLLFYSLGGTAAGLIVAACIIGFNFGGNFALFPAATADFFGNKTVGVNYGWVFTAYGIAGIAGPQIAGYFKDAAKGAETPAAWLTPFVIAGVVCLLAGVIGLLLRPPRRAASAG